MVVGSSILKINPNRLLLEREKQRCSSYNFGTVECVCWRRFKYFFLSFFLVFFAYSFSDRKDFCRKIANWISLF
jgi:hypothetical protein